MKKRIVFKIVFILTILSSFGQDCKQDFFNARLDSNYLRSVSQTITEELSSCKIPNIEWTDNINNPRILSYFYTIKLTCQGKVISATIDNSQFEYKNAKGETTKSKADFESLKILEDCIKNKLLNLKTLKALYIDKETQNTEINSGFSLKL